MVKHTEWLKVLSGGARYCCSPTLTAPSPTAKFLPIQAIAQPYQWVWLYCAVCKYSMLHTALAS